VQVDCPDRPAKRLAAKHAFDELPAMLDLCHLRLGWLPALPRKEQIKGQNTPINFRASRLLPDTANDLYPRSLHLWSIKSPNNIPPHFGDLAVQLILVHFHHLAVVIVTLLLGTQLCLIGGLVHRGLALPDRAPTLIALCVSHAAKAQCGVHHALTLHGVGGGPITPAELAPRKGRLPP
jgi:hypothetical protein